MLDDMALVETQDLLSARPLGQDSVVPQRTIRKEKLSILQHYFTGLGFLVI